MLSAFWSLRLWISSLAGANREDFGSAPGKGGQLGRARSFPAVEPQGCEERFGVGDVETDDQLGIAFAFGFMRQSREAALSGPSTSRSIWFLA